MKVKFDKEKVKEFGKVIKDIAWNPEVMLLTGTFAGLAINEAIYKLTPRFRPEVKRFVKVATDMWNDMPVGVGYQSYKITPDDCNKLHNPLFFLISEEDEETGDFAK